MERPKNSRDLGAFRFRFAVIADSHLEPEPEARIAECRSNSRTRRIVEDVNSVAPEFVVHLGDVVHPVPALPTFVPAAAAAQDILGGLNSRCYITPGNHDIGDKPAYWMPAATVTPDWVKLYERYFGASYQSFDFGDLHAVLLNSPILNTGHALEQAQRDWLERDLKKSRGRRTWLFTHYPPYLRVSSEEGHYDNIDEPARSWLLSLLEDYRVEALFCGHVHNFFYDRLRSTEIYLAPSTSFVRRDYAELFRVSPTDEFGKNDPAKLGWFAVDVYEHGHVARFERSGGRLARSMDATPARRRVPHPKEAREAALGVHLRHPWAEVVEFPYSGPVDEFNRRKVRNDYAVAAFWEIGLRSLRVPLHDLRDDAVRQRMQVLASLGHRFTVFLVGAPDDDAIALLRAHSAIVHALECVLPAADVVDAKSRLARLKRATALPIYVAWLQTTADEIGDVAEHGSSFKHHVSPGFLAGQLASTQAYLRELQRDAEIDGLTFRLRLSDDPGVGLPAIAAFARQHSIRAMATICLGGDGPNDNNFDDAAIAHRVARAALAAHAFPDIEVYLDTFVDMDRGYSTRYGLVDRRYNLRAAGDVLRNLNAFLAVLPKSDGTLRVDPDGSVALIAGKLFVVVTRGNSDRVHLRTDMPALAVVPRVMDLISGADVPCRCDPRADGLTVEYAALGDAPALVVVGGQATGRG